MMKNPGKILVILILLALLTSACASRPKSRYTLASLESMPADVQTQPETVQQAYQFAVANPEILNQIPCYCGCVGLGHTSNYACYVSGQNPDGTPIFEEHAQGCSICVDITQDVMHMMDQNKPISAIQASIDQTYSRFGPPTTGN